MRLLLVEDEERLLDSLVFQLEQEGFSVDACRDGEEALYYIQQNLYDLILLDRMLPLLDGTEVLKTMRRSHNSTPVILITALGTLDDKVTGLDLGADDYLVKPFAYLVCCLHWFNPLVWTAFFLMEKDMEASCDEAVIRKIGYDRRKEYANVLLGLSQSRRWRTGYPIAFGENNVKDRIKGVVKMKKARLGVVTLAVGIILAAAVLLLVNRTGETPAADGEVTANPSQEQSETARLRDEASDDQETQPTVEEESSGIPDLRMREYYSAEELLEDDGSNYSKRR